MLSICAWETNGKEKKYFPGRWMTLLIAGQNQFLAHTHSPCSRLKPKRTEWFSQLSHSLSFVIWNECTYQGNIQGCPVVPWPWLGIWSSIGVSEQGYLRTPQRKSFLKSAGHTYRSRQGLDSPKPLGTTNRLSTPADATSQRAGQVLPPAHCQRSVTGS